MFSNDPKVLKILQSAFDHVNHDFNILTHQEKLRYENQGRVAPVYAEGGQDSGCAEIIKSIFFESTIPSCLKLLPKPTSP